MGKTKSMMGKVFLADDAYLRAIAEAARIKPTDNVLEIGMGRGQLTQFLVRRAARVVAVEIDPRLAEETERAFADFPNLTIIEGDVLDIDIEDALGDAVPAVCVGNIPYYITGPIIDLLFEYRKIIPSWFLLLQKEVARRVVARPGSKEYGRLTVRLQFYGVPAIELEIPRVAFEPVPEVDSALVSYYYRDEPPVGVADIAAFFRTVDYLFAERRKKVRNRLPGLVGGVASRAYVDEVLGSLSINGDARPEDLSLEEFARLHNRLEDIRPSG